MNDKRDASRSVFVDYVNHRGYRSIRQIIPLKIYFGHNEWLLDCFDFDRLQNRTFAMAGIREWNVKVAK